MSIVQQLIWTKFNFRTPEPGFPLWVPAFLAISGVEMPPASTLEDLECGATFPLLVRRSFAPLLP